MAARGWRTCSVAQDGATASPASCVPSGSFARQRSKYRHATTDSRHGGPIAPNRVQGLTVQRPNQVWVTDATGVLTGQGWLYLVEVLDVYTRRVLGWAMSPALALGVSIRVRGQSFFLALFER